VGLFGLAMAAAAAAIFARTVANYHGALDTNLRVPWLVLAIAFVLAESCALHLQFRGNSQTFTPDEVLIVIGLFTVAVDAPRRISLGWRGRVGRSASSCSTHLCRSGRSAARRCRVPCRITRSTVGAHNWIRAVATIAAACSITAMRCDHDLEVVDWCGRNVVFGLFGTTVDGVRPAVILPRVAAEPAPAGRSVAIVFVAYRVSAGNNRGRAREFLCSASAF
jgi:hypothetical protein